MAYKWNPGHYVMATPNTGFDEVLTAIKDIPNLRGIQMRVDWKQFETAMDVYDVSLLTHPTTGWLTKLNNAVVPAGTPKKRLRILLTYKSFTKAGYATPAYIQSNDLAKYDDGAPLYRKNADGTDDLTKPVFGVYDYGVGWHPKFYNPWIRDRFKKLMQKLGELLDGQPLLEDILLNETAYGGAQVPLNGLTWDTPAGLQKFRERSTAHANALFDIYLAAKAAFPTTMIGQYVNFPNTGKFSIIKDPANPATTPGWPAGTALPPKMALNGITLGGPDSWLGDTSADVGPFQMYKANRGIIPLSPSVQNANYAYLNHADQVFRNADGSIGKPTGTITVQELYWKATQDPRNSDADTTNNVVTLYATHVTWSAADYVAALPHTKTSWVEVQEFFLNKWQVGPDAGNLSPGVDTTLPATLAAGGVVVPPKPVLSLAVDSGVSATDLITNNATINVDRGGTTGGRVEYATRSSGPWSTTVPAFVQGPNIVFARQFSAAGMVSETSEPFTFEYCNTKPQLIWATFRETYAIIGFQHPIAMTNAPRPGKAAFTLKANGNTITSTTGTFVNADQTRVRIDWTTPLVGGETVTASYAVPTDDTKLQDVAGNTVDAFTNFSGINLIGLPPLTASCAITAVGGKAANIPSNNNLPLITGTVSEPLMATMDIEVQRKKHDGGFKFVGWATVTGTTWSYQETVPLEDNDYTYRVRARHGDVNSTAGYSAEFVTIIDTEPPGAPYIISMTVRTGSGFTLRGGWSGNPDDTLVVAISGVGGFDKDNGLILSSSAWSVNLPSLTPGLYIVGASITDLAGNTAYNDEIGEIIVTPGFGKSSLILRTYKRRPI